MNNILQVLLSPLTKLGSSAAEQTRALTSMEAILWRWDNTYNVGEEIKNQTALLGDIKQLLIQQNKQFFGRNATKNRKDEDSNRDKALLGDASKFKALKDTAGMAAMVIGISIAIVGASLILSTVTPISPMQIVTALAIAGLIMLVTPAFVKIGDAFFGSKLEENTDKEGSSKSMTNKGGFLGVAGALVGLLGMLSIVVIGSYLLTLMATPSLVQLATALFIGALFVPLGYAFSLIAAQLAKGVGTKSAGFEGMEASMTDTSGIWGLVGGSMVALIGMVATLTISSYLLLLMAVPSGAQFLAALGIAIIMIPLAFSLSQIMATMAKSKHMRGMEGVKMVGLAMLVMVGGVAGLVAASYVLQLINTNLTAAHFITAILVGLSLIPVALAMGLIIRALDNAGIKANMQGVGMVLLAGLALAVMAAGIVGAAWILMMLPDPNEMLAHMPPLMWSVTVGLAMVAFAFSYALILRAMQGASIAEMLLAGAALVIMALAILGVAWMFTHLPDTWNGPDFMWSFKIGVALLMFGISFALIAVLVNKFNLSTTDLLKALMVTVVLSIAIFLVAWVFTLLPGNFVSPPLDWTAQAALAIGSFGGVLAILGKVMGGGAGIVAIAIAAVGAIIVAVAILAIAWIFNFLPDLGSIADNISNLITVPINKMIDILVRLKDEIGIENLIPLAIGIGAISMALLLLAGATAGLAAGGVLAALGGAAEAFIGGITEFFGGERKKGPLEILEMVVNMRQGIAETVPILEGFGRAASAIVMAGSAGNTIGEILKGFVDYGEDAGEGAEEFGLGLKEIDLGKIQALWWPMESISKSLYNIGNKVPLTSVKAATNFVKVLSESSFDKQAAALERIAKAYKSISRSTQLINQVSMDKTTEMIKALSYLSSKGGEGAIRELGDNLIGAIQELGNIFDKYLEGQGTPEGSVDEEGNFTKNPGPMDLGGGGSDVVAAIKSLQTTLTRTGVKVNNGGIFG